MKNEKYVIITCSGNAINVNTRGDYWSLLDSIHSEYQSAGGNWDRPNMLMLNGKIVVESGLAELAWAYGSEKARDVRDTLERVRTGHYPKWLSDFEREQEKQG